MRITGGTLAGRRLRVPAGAGIRPSGDRLRESLFQRLSAPAWRADRADQITGARVLDAFCGSGALGLEALSRGAAHVTFLDRDPRAARRNLDALGIAPERVRLRRGDATRPPPAPAPCELLLLDPPYGRGLAARALPALARAGWIAPTATLVIEAAAREAVTPPEGFVLQDRRRLGDSEILILAPIPASAPDTPTG